jgi:hypothetical protein
MLEIFAFIWPLIHTVVLPPTTEALIKVESSFAVPQLHIRKPFCNNVEKGCIDADDRTCPTISPPSSGSAIHNHRSK